MTLYSEGAEQGLVARLLLDPRQIALIQDKVGPDDFYIPAYRQAYRVMLELQQERKVPDIVSLQARGVDVDVLDLTPMHHAPLDSYAEEIKHSSFRRKVLAASDRVARAAELGDGDLMSVVSEAFTEIVQGTEQGDLATSSEAVDDYLGTLAERIAGEGLGMTYGVPKMDGHLLPAEPGDLIIMAARPSVGKSAMAENVADHWARLDQGPVLYVSLEMRKTKIIDRTISRYSGIGANKVIRGQLDPEEVEVVQAEAARLRDRPIVWLDNGFATSADVRAAAAKTRLLYEGKLAGIVVDYLQILKDPGESEVQRVTRISRNLKAIAVENDCPVLALSQFSRRMEQERRDPVLSDLRESGAIEQDADVVIAMTRTLESPVMSVHILKQRQGSVGKFGLHFEGDTSTFTELRAEHLAAMAAEAEDDATGW